MTDSKAPARPPQVTMAGWVTVVGSLFMLVNVFGVVSRLRSLDTRENVTDALSRDPLKGTGIDLEQALSLMHGTALVAGATAAAAAILGWFVLQRNHHARVALSVIALPLFFSGLVAGGFVSSMIAVSVVILWGRPARDWFNGVTPPERPQRVAPPEQGDAPWQAPTPPPEQGPRAFEGFGSKPVEQPGPVAQRPTPGAGRPREVVQACAFTWAMCGTAVLGLLMVLVGFALSPELVKEVYESDSRFAESDISLSALRTAAIVVSIVFALWSVAAMVVAWFAFRGAGWARILLIVSAAVAAAFSLATAISSPPMLVVTGVAVFTVVRLTQPPSVAWFAEKDRERREARR
ncbi:hypothetical protein ncot_01430 [Nocardioides sp. JQ2195]|uniref:proline-rich domain-containing protein n=1 Tax=Nocardioides sp. JQ2195 TaxID=2592334 RepID=UPI00143E9764|nr:proline-rich domain-containing protein [Nocardioides sp. JQ2195]QIX25397.1 hypothetical protein ncot_01430 [Nocardioides sp. JQ2195]